MEEQILIVDDEENICNILARRLTGEGYLCVTANNGREAHHHLYRVGEGQGEAIRSKDFRNFLQRENL
jgi:DNA-binding NtrC family response regulator